MTSLSARFALRFGLTAAIAGFAALAVSLFLFAGRMTDVARDAHAGFHGVMTGQMERAGDFMVRELAARSRTALLDLDAGALTRIAQTATGGGLADAVTFYDADGRAVADQGGPLPLDAAAPPRRLLSAGEDVTVHWREDEAFLSGRPVCIAGRCVGWAVATLDASALSAEQAAIEAQIDGARGAFLADAAILGLGALALTAAVAALTGSRLGARAQAGATAVLRAIERMTASSRDVRARPRAEQLADMRTLAAALADDASGGAPPDAIGEAALVADPTGVIEHATPALHALLRVAPTTLEGADAHVTFALDPTGSAETLARAFERLAEAPTGDGQTVPILAAAAIAGEGSGQRVVCVVRSAERLIDAERAEALRRFRVAAADEARDAFLDVMRDEIGAARKLRAGDGGETPAKRGLGTKLAGAVAPVARAGDRVLRLLRLRRAPEAPPTDPVDPAKLATAIAEGVAAAADFKRLPLTVRVQPGAPVVVGDFEALRRIGAAFADNAVAATARGEVVIDVAHRVVGEMAEIALTVQDSGAGLDAAGLRTVSGILSKPGDRGSGLAVAARLAKAMGAAIDVGGAPGDGASFTLTFRAPVDPNAPPASQPAASDPAGGASAGGMAALAPMTLGPLGLPPLGPGEGEAETEAGPSTGDGESDGEAAPLVSIPMATGPVMGGDAPDPAEPSDAAPLTAVPMAAAPIVGGDSAEPDAAAADATAETEATPDAETNAEEETAESGEPEAEATTDADGDAPPATPQGEDASENETAVDDAQGPTRDASEPQGVDDDRPDAADPSVSEDADASNPTTAATAADDGDTPLAEADVAEQGHDDGSSAEAAENASEPEAAPVAIVADSSQVDRIVLTTFLRKAGYACEIAATPADVLDAVRNRPALLLLGADFGGADASQLVETLRAREKASSTQPLAIYGVAGAADEASAEALRSAGVDDVIARPIRRDTLEAKLGARLDRAAS